MGTLSDILEEVDFQNDIIEPLVDNGWYDFVFPFLMIYAILITILSQVPMFKDKKGIRVVIALVFSLFAVAFPITDNSCPSASGLSVSDGCTIGDFLIVLFPGVTALSIAILALYIAAAMMGLDLMKFFNDGEGENKWIKWGLGAVALIVIGLYIAKGFGYDVGDGSEIEEFFTDPLLWVLIVAGFVFYYITKDEPSDYEKYAKKVAKLKDKGLTMDEIEKTLGPRPSKDTSGGKH